MLSQTQSPEGESHCKQTVGDQFVNEGVSVGGPEPPLVSQTHLSLITSPLQLDVSYSLFLQLQVPTEVDSGHGKHSHTLEEPISKSDPSSRLC